MRNRIRFAVAVLSLVTLTTVACATMPYRGGHHPLVRGRVVFVGGYYYDPFFGPYPWWQPAAYPRAYFPVFDERAQIRVLVTPNTAAVYIDGFYAGVVDDFDGVLQWRPLPPGGHEVVFYLNGYRTDRQMVHLHPASRLNLRLTMERLAPGEDSERPRIAPMVPAPPPGTFKSPSTPQREAR